MLSSEDQEQSDALTGVFVSQRMSNLAWLVMLFLVHRADLGQPLSEGCRGDVVQEALGGRMTPSHST